MGGKTTTESSTNQSSTTAPWIEAQPHIKGILAQIGTQLNGTGITGTENDALSRLTANAGQNNQFAPQINSFIGDLLNGGGASTAPINMTAGPNQSGQISQTLADYQRRLNPIADGANVGPNGNPALKGYLDTIANDVQTRVNGMFAGAGRDLSGANQGTLARGIAQGTAPILAQQYNTDIGNQRSAADSLYGAGNTTSGLLEGIRSQDYSRDYQRELGNRQLGQQALANRQVGTSMAPTVQNQFADQQKQILEAEALRRGIPVQALGLLANIGIPIAGLGQQTQGQGFSKGEQQMSGAQQFGLIANGANSMINPLKWLFG